MHEFKTYEEAIEELFIVNYIGDFDHSKPMETLAKLVKYEIALSLDPKISQQAVDLIEKHGGTV